MPDDPPCWRCVDHVPPGYYCPICGRTNHDYESLSTGIDFPSSFVP